MAEVNVLPKERLDELKEERLDELRRKLWEDYETMKDCIPEEQRQKVYKGYFNNVGIRRVSESVKKHMVLRIGASLDFDIEEIETTIKNTRDHEGTLSDILKVFLSDSLISDWDFYQKLRKILRRYELQDKGNAVGLKAPYEKWIEVNIPIDTILKQLDWGNMKEPYSYILCVDDLNKLEPGTPIPSAYLLFKIYSNLIVCCKNCENETIKKFKGDLEKLLNDKFYFCFFPWKKTFIIKAEKQLKYTYSNQTLIDIVDNIFPSCFYSDSLLDGNKISDRDKKDRKELWNKHLIQLKTKETLHKYRVDLPDKKNVKFRKIRSESSSVEDFL